MAWHWEAPLPALFQGHPRGSSLCFQWLPCFAKPLLPSYKKPDWRPQRPALTDNRENMPLLSALRAVHDYSRDESNAYLANTDKFLWRLGDVVGRTWDLGFTAFGGPPVHFQIEHRRFVQGTHGRIPWIDERVVSLVSSWEVALCKDVSLYSSSIKSYSRFVKPYPDQEALRCYSASFSSTPAYYLHCLSSYFGG